MVRRVHLASPIFCMLACALWASGQSVSPASTSPPLEHRPTAIQPTGISLGQSLAPLYGPWKFQVAIRPRIRNRQTAMGRACLRRFSMGIGRPDAIRCSQPRCCERMGESRPPGLQRLCLVSHARCGPFRGGNRSALAGPANFDDAYQVFLNGRFLGSLGNSTASSQSSFTLSRPRFH